MKVEMQFFSFAATTWWLLFFCFGKKSKRIKNNEFFWSPQVPRQIKLFLPKIWLWSLMTQSPFKKSINQRLLKFIESKRKVVLTTYSVKSFLCFMDFTRVHLSYRSHKHCLNLTLWKLTFQTQIVRFSNSCYVRRISLNLTSDLSWFKHVDRKWIVFRAPDRFAK